MTLGLALTMLRRHTGLTTNDLSDPIATQILNEGWVKAAMESGNGLHGYWYDGIKANQSIYALPLNAVKVHLVRLLNGSTCLAELTPRDQGSILTRDASGEVPASIPNSCSVTNMKHETGVACWELRLFPPPNWTYANGGIEIYCDWLPTYIQADTDVPDVRTSLADAGLWWACFMLAKKPTGQFERDDSTKFMQLFRDAVATDIRANGIRPLVMHRPPQFSGHNWLRNINAMNEI